MRSSLIGETWQPQLTRTRTESHTASGAMSLLWNGAIRLLAQCYGFSWGESVSVTDRLAPQILPHDLATLRTGGKPHRFLVDVDHRPIRHHLVPGPQLPPRHPPPGPFPAPF